MYKLTNNKWLISIYNIRHQWVPLFIVNTFFAGMSSTQRSESMNAFVQSFVSHHTSLLEFITRYEDCLRKQRETENICDYKSRHKDAKMESGVAMEKQVNDLYTRKLFYCFQFELNKSLFFNVYPSQENDPNAKVCISFCRVSNSSFSFRITLTIMKSESNLPAAILLH